jgi:lipopolysaccharide export system protein LptA
MRWQKTARIVIAAAVIVFTAIVFLALRRNRPVSPPAESPRTDERTVIEGGKVAHRRHDASGKLLFDIVTERQLTYADGRSTLEKGRITLPDRGGRTVAIAGDRIELLVPPDKGGELTRAKAVGHVQITTSDGLTVNSEEATYGQASGMISIPGDVRFSRGRLTGSGAGATYDQNRQVLWLLKNAHLTIAPDEKGQGATEATAAAAGFARAEHYVRLTGSGHIVGDARTIDSDDITIQLTEDEKRVRTLQLRGNSRITGTSPGAQNMAARDIDVTYGEDGRAIQQATLVENATVELPGADGAPARRIGARTIVLGMAPDGATLTRLNANEGVVLELPATGGAPPRRITAASLDASGAGPGGLEAATFTGNVEFRETSAAAKGKPPSERVARAERLIVATKPGFGDIQQADFRGRVRFEDGATTGESQRAVYRLTEGTLELVSSQDPGPPPRLSDDRMSVDAGTINLGLESRKLTAETNVRTASKPKPQDARSGTGEKGGDTSRLPSMLKSEEPAFVHAQKLEYDGTSTATYNGDARLFQGQTTVEGDTIVLDDRSGNMTARGRVRTVMFFDDVDPKTKQRKPMQTTGTADELVYEDAKRLATYTTGSTASAHIVGPQGDVTAETIRLFLKPKDNELERAEADGKVTVKEGQRVARGDHLVYTAADETYVLKGNPLEVDRFETKECTRTMGVTLQFRRGDDTLIVDGIPGVTPFNTKPIPCSK